MIKAIEKKMLEQNAHAVKYIKIVSEQGVDTKIKRLNTQIDRDFGLAGPFTLSTVSERVHSVRWATARETFVVETHVKRVFKEIVAAGISQINKCVYCEDVHGTSITSIGDNQTANAIANGTWKDLKDQQIKSIIEWSINTRNPKAAIIKNPSFSEQESVEIIGTALLFHSTNRLVSIFLGASPLPSFLASKFMKKTALKIASKTLFKSMVMKKPKAGESLSFISDYPISNNYDWISTETIAKPFEARAHLMHELEISLIPKKLGEIFKEHVKNWEGEEMPLGKVWLNKIMENVEQKHQAKGKILFLAAFSPYTITKNDIQAFQESHPSDEELLEVCYWAIQILTDRIGEWLTKPFIS